MIDKHRLWDKISIINDIIPVIIFIVKDFYKKLNYKTMRDYYRTNLDL